MKIAKVFVRFVSLLVIGIAASGGPGARAASGPAIFVDNYNYVTAYPLGANGNVAPIAITPDMVSPAGIARDDQARIYVTNPSTNTIAIYSGDATGNLPALEIISGYRTRLANPTAIALDQQGNIYVLNTATATITVYAPLPPFITVAGGPARLNQPPIAVIAGPKTKLKQPVALAVDGSGDIYVANQAGGPVVANQGFTLGAITIYAAGSKGNVAPTAIITGPTTGLVDPVSIAVDSSRNIYVGNVFTNVGGSFIYQPNISIYPAGSEGDAQPTSVVTGTNPGLYNLIAIGLDSNRNIYAVGYGAEGNNLIDVFPAGSTGNIAPTATIIGADTGLNAVRGLTFDPNGNLYALDDGGGPAGNGSITVYASGSTGDAAPIDTITSSFTAISSSTGIAIDSRGGIYLSNGAGGPDFPGGSLAIFPAGSYAATAPVSVIAGDNTGLESPQKVAVDARGDISVLNFNNTVTVYSAGSTGNVTPEETINLKVGNLGSTGIARGLNDQLYVANQGAVRCNDDDQNCNQTSLGSIDIYSAHADGNANPSAIISGYGTGIASPSGIAVSERGNIFVTNQGPLSCSCLCFPAGPGSITVYARGSEANAKPIATIQGPQTRLALPGAIGVDSSENIYVLEGDGLPSFGCPGEFGGERTETSGRAKNSLPGEVPDIYLVSGVFDFSQIATGDSILVFKAGSNGDTPPIATIAGPFTAVGGSAIAIGPVGP
jgi:hypothetical protein